MGSVYERQDSPVLWMKWRDAAGKRRQAATRFRKGDAGQLEEARRALALLEREVAAQRREGAGELTVRRWGERWVAGLRRRGVVSADQYQQRLRDFIHPAIGDLGLKEVRPSHVAALVNGLREDERDLAPRMVRHIYGQLHAMFQAALRKELIPGNPCALERHELPRKEDKDPSWRATAIFARAEVEQLLSDERLPEDRRALYAVMFLAGTRIGEALELHWEAYDAEAEPLGRLTVATSWSTRRQEVNPTKTRAVKRVPVHPTLARVLAAWRLSGWGTLIGRPPRAADLLFPAADGGHRNGNASLATLHRDLKLLGLRPRRQHDARRTFISLALGDGASKELLRWVTHAPEGVIDEYLTPPWDALCANVAKLRIRLLEGKLVALPLAGGAATASYAGPEGPDSPREEAWAKRDSNPPRAPNGSSNRPEPRPQGAGLPPTRPDLPVDRSPLATLLPWERGPCVRPRLGLAGGRP